jgi:hypothetical protein
MKNQTESIDVLGDRLAMRGRLGEMQDALAKATDALARNDNSSVILWLGDLCTIAQDVMDRLAPK